jgi:hypothetical protein
MSPIQHVIIALLDFEGFPYLADQLKNSMTSAEAYRYINSIASDLSTSEYEFLSNTINDFFKPTNQPTNQTK